MSAYTPGPWKFATNKAGRLAIVGAGNNGRHITSDRVANCPRRKDGNGEANANLIAAAPDLAEAAVGFLDWFVTFIGRETYAEINASELNALIRAIDKSGVRS